MTDYKCDYCGEMKDESEMFKIIEDGIEKMICDVCTMEN